MSRTRVGRRPVRPRADSGTGQLEALGGSLWASSGHSLSITARISSEMTATFSISSMYLCNRRRSAGVMTLPATMRGKRSDLQTMLKTPSGLHEIAHAVFKDTGRLHVDSIAFTVPQILRTDGHGAKWLSGEMVAIYNPQPRFPCAEIRSMRASSSVDLPSLLGIVTRSRWHPAVSASRFVVGSIRSARRSRCTGQQLLSPRRRWCPRLCQLLSW